MFSLKEEKKSTKIILFSCCIIFFMLCAFTAIYYGNSTLLGNLKNPDNDDVKFIRSAWILAKTGKYIYHYPSTSTVFMMPGLSSTLAIVTLIFGEGRSLTEFRILQSLIQTGSLALVFFIGRKIFNSKVGLIAVILNILYTAEIWVSSLILTETFFKFFVLLLIYFSLYAIEQKKMKYYILGGAAWGFATLFRPTIATFPAVILIMWLFKKYSFKDILKYTITVVLIFSVILSPWWIRNYRTFGKFIPLTLATGNPMLQGTYINYDQKTKATDGLDYSQFVYPGNEIGNNELEMNMSKYRLKNLVPKHPFQYLYWYTIGKTIEQINFPFYWHQILGVSVYLQAFYHYLLLILCVVGVIFFFINKSRNKMGTFIFMSIIYFILVYLPFYAFSRYFYPAMPCVIIFAAAALLNIYEEINIIKQNSVKNKQ